MHSSFTESEFAPYEASGKSAITGQAFLKTRGGDVKYGAGCTVTLLPVTSYTTEIRQRATIAGEHIGPEDPRLNKYRRSTVADGSGNFEFKNLPAGKYYLSCPIYWEVAGYVSHTTGGVVIGETQVGEGESVKVILTQ
jgi:hypothetical protein